VEVAEFRDRDLEGDSKATDKLRARANRQYLGMDMTRRSWEMGGGIGAILVVGGEVVEETGRINVKNQRRSFYLFALHGVFKLGCWWLT
jgi:hypothetical protein